MRQLQAAYWIAQVRFMEMVEGSIIVIGLASIFWFLTAGVAISGVTVFAASSAMLPSSYLTYWMTVSLYRVEHPQNFCIK